MAKEMIRGSALSPKAQELMDLALSLNKALNVDEILLDLAKRVTEVCAAEGITIYAIDQEKKQLFSKVKINHHIKEIRLDISMDSVAGYSAKTGRTVNMADPYDPEELKKYPGLKFDDSWDQVSGYKTRSILCVPLQFKDTGLQGVIQVVNHTKGRTFSTTAEKLLNTVARALAVAFFNQSRIRKEPTRFDLLLEREAITPVQLEQARMFTRNHSNDPIKGDLVSVLMSRFGVSRVMMAKSLEDFFQTPVYEFRENTSEVYDLIEELDLPAKYLGLNLWVPISKKEGVMTIVTDDPKDTLKINEIASVIKGRGFGGEFRFIVGFRADIKKFLDPDYIPSIELGVRREVQDEDDGSIEYDENAPTIVKLVNDIVRQAILNDASDIHIEPYPGKQPTTVRLRMDGVCFKYSEIRKRYSNGVINRFKIMANLKLDEHRIPQSGKIRLKFQEKDVELRVEVTPTYGDQEDVVLRILTSSKPLRLDALNFSPANHEKMRSIIQKPYGIILAVGPTGSGKTTTLHSFLGFLNTPDKKIWTVEDPVEITQKGLRQVQVNPHIRPQPFNFATAMRSFLRADPDIIMVGEMRDRETAKIAIEASLTGHLVLSTLHTNSAPETVTRIVEMDLDPINVSDAILGILAQRLVRTLCERCREKYAPEGREVEELLEEYGPQFAADLNLTPDVSLFRAVGCPKCNDTGYKGRTGIHELLVGTPAVKKMIRERASAMELRNLALEEGMRTLKMDGIQKVLQGQTDLSQVLKVCIE